MPPKIVSGDAQKKVDAILENADEYYRYQRDLRFPRHSQIPEEVMWKMRFRALVMALVEELG